MVIVIWMFIVQNILHALIIQMYMNLEVGRTPPSLASDVISRDHITAASRLFGLLTSRDNGTVGLGQYCMFRPTDIHSHYSFSLLSTRD